METIHKGTRRGHKSPFVARWWATRRWTIEDNAIVTTNATTIFAATYCKSASGGCLTPNQDHTRTVFTYTCITHYHLYKILHRHIYVKILLYTKAISTHTFSENNRHLDTLLESTRYMQRKLGAITINSYMIPKSSIESIPSSTVQVHDDATHISHACLSSQGTWCEQSIEYPIHSYCHYLTYQSPHILLWSKLDSNIWLYSYRNKLLSIELYLLVI